jgi:hypothetical protein
LTTTLASQRDWPFYPYSSLADAANYFNADSGNTLNIGASNKLHGDSLGIETVPLCFVGSRGF